MGDQATHGSGMRPGYGMTVGTPQITSAGPITFGPDDVLFLADNRSATIFVIQVADDGSAAPADAFDLADLDTKLSVFLGRATDDFILRECRAIRTHNVYLSVMRGRGQRGAPVIVRIDHRDGSLSEIGCATSPSRRSASTSAATDDPRIDVSLTDPDGTEVEIQELDIQGRKLRIVQRCRRGRRPSPTWRTSTARCSPRACRTRSSLEAAAHPVPVRAARRHRQQPRDLPRLPRQVGDRRPDPHLRPLRRRRAASWPATRARRWCTSRWPTSPPGRKTSGRTVAELGAVNQPLDMVSFDQDGEEHLLSRTAPTA